MNAFAAAMAEESATARAELLAAQSREDEVGVRDAVNRLRDLAEIAARVREGSVVRPA